MYGHHLIKIKSIKKSVADKTDSKVLLFGIKLLKK